MARRPGLRYRLKRNRRPVDQQDHLAAENAANNFLQSVSLADRANRDKPLFEDGDQRARRGLCWKAEMLNLPRMSRARSRSSTAPRR